MKIHGEMTTIAIKNKFSRNSERLNTSSISRKYSSNDTRRINVFDDRPKPLDFDTFLPWVCMEMQVPNVVTVTRMVNQEKIDLKNISTGKSNSIRSIWKNQDDLETFHKERTSVSNTIALSNILLDNFVPIKAYYDPQGHLAEIAIVGCTTKIPRKVIQAVRLCLPFHPFLIKVVIRQGGLHSALIREIGKLLLHSNITDICLDDTNVPEGNYYVLLEHVSKLKCLSLCRCNINDDVINEIFSRLDFGRRTEKTLMLLNLSSNVITDIGAKYIGEILRRNRHLLHLNLAGNRISDVGLYFIMQHLSEFPLSHNEAVERKRRIFEYFKKKTEVFKKCLEEIPKVLQPLEAANQHTDKRLSFTNKYTKLKKIKKHITNEVEELPPAEKAERKTKEIVGEFVDPFANKNVNKKDDYCYCVGNLKLCSLNMACNQLGFISLVRILDVLKYQYNLKKTSENTGLMRIILDGNYLPQSCFELDLIKMYLAKAIAAQITAGTHSPSRKKQTFKHFD